MGVIDKVQSGMQKVTGGGVTGTEARLNAAEVVTLQQAFNSMQLGLVKSRFYAEQTQNDEVRTVLNNIVDDFVKPNLERCSRILQQGQIQTLQMNAEERANNLPKVQRVLMDDVIVLDTVLAMQSTILGLQAGALAAVRGDVRDFFLEARDAAVDQWRRLGMVATKVIPQAIPPQLGAATS